MKQPLLLLLATASVMLISCRKDNPQEPQPEQFPTYLPLSTGNYWVYQRYSVDWATGQATATNVLDSCFISKDTLIHGQRYYKLVRPNYVGSLLPNDHWYVRDSLHYLVNHHGRRLFSSQDHASVFSQDYVTVDPTASRPDTICEIKAQMAAQPASVSAPAGSFTALDYQQKYRFFLPWSRDIGPRTMHTAYAQNVGIITETLPFFLSSPTHTERRLLRYRLN